MYRQAQQLDLLDTPETESTAAFPNNDITLLSLFAGAGGLDIGFEQAGFHTVWANEFDKSIAPSFQNYFPETTFDGRSIVNITEDDLPLTAGIIGGPPCQSWSETGARRGINDHRGQLFFEYIRVLTHVKPKFFVAENVSGILHSKNKQSFDSIVSLFSDAGYDVFWQKLNASDYEVPQDSISIYTNRWATFLMLSSSSGE